MLIHAASDGRVSALLVGGGRVLVSDRLAIRDERCKKVMPKELRQPYSGIYSIQDAAVFLRATTPPRVVQLAAWKRKRQQFIGPSSRHIHSWIRRTANGQLPPDDRHPVLNFEQLIRARMTVLFRTHGLPLATILEAEGNMRTMTGLPQPFVTQPMWSSSSDMYFEFEEMIRVATKPHQLVFGNVVREFMTPIHHGIEFDKSEIAMLWRPMPGVLIDPELQFGSPCVEGTRVETESLWSFRQSGEEEGGLADLFALSVEQVNQALAWEETLARAA